MQEQFQQFIPAQLSTEYLPDCCIRVTVLLDRVHKPKIDIFKLTRKVLLCVEVRRSNQENTIVAATSMHSL